MCVKEGIQSLNYRSLLIKLVVDYIIDHSSINREWQKWYKVYHKAPKKFKKDGPHRWNSAYLLLDNMVEYKEL